MATTRATLTDQAGRTIEIQATPDHANDPAFDSFVVLHENGTDNHTLTLVLRLYLHQVGPAPWGAADFALFKKEFLRHCAHWNNKFWLTPPAGFSKFDYKVDGRTVRPNVYCHLYIDVVSSDGAAHRKFDVANEDVAAQADLRSGAASMAREVGYVLGLPHGGPACAVDEGNAKPWRERIAMHTGTRAADWKVSVKAKQAPKYL